MTAAAHIDVGSFRRTVPLLPLLPPESKPRQVGKDTFRALCSFHAEKTPSMQVKLHKGVWRFHCFGCHEDGDAIDYVMRTARVSFKEAVRRLGGTDLQPAPPPPKRPGVMVVPCASKGCGATCELDADEVHLFGVRGWSPRDFAGAGWTLTREGAWCPTCPPGTQCLRAGSDAWLAWKVRVALVAIAQERIERVHKAEDERDRRQLPHPPPVKSEAA